MIPEYFGAEGLGPKILRLVGIETAEPLECDVVSVTAVVVSADGSRIFLGNRDGRVRVWDAVSGEAVGEVVEAHQGCVCSLAVSANALIASYSVGDIDRIWDTATNECVRTITSRYSFSSSAEMLAAAGFSAPAVGPNISVYGWMIALTPRDGGMGAHLATVDSYICRRGWVVDESLRDLWVGLLNGGVWRAR
jgi:WD40 repeat protein